MPPERQPIPSAKTRAWTLLTVLGLILTAVGALVGVIELRPQISVTPQEQLASGQPFSAPFEITNAGYLSLHIDNVIAVVHMAVIGGTAFGNASSGNKDWDNFDLERGKSKTMLYYFSNGMPTKADMIIAIDYEFLGKKWRSFYRFQGIYMEKWQWSKQPMGELEPELNKVVDEALINHRQANTPIAPN